MGASLFFAPLRSRRQTLGSGPLCLTGSLHNKWRFRWPASALKFMGTHVSDWAPRAAAGHQQSPSWTPTGQHALIEDSLPTTREGSTVKSHTGASPRLRLGRRASSGAPEVRFILVFETCYKQFILQDLNWPWPAGQRPWFVARKLRNPVDPSYIRISAYADYSVPGRGNINK